MVERIADVVAATEPKPKFIMEDVRPAVKLVVKPSQPRQVDDDWFALLDVAAKIKPGILQFYVWLLL